LKPIRDTAEALARLASYGDTTVADILVKMGQLAVEIVPDCVGLSLDCRHNGVMLTLVATCEDTALLDAIQYLDGGPTTEAIETDAIVVVTDPDDLFDENRWQLFAQLSAASGVASTLSMPVHDGGDIVGAVTLYAGSPNAFDGLHQQLADAFGAYAPDAVINADLSFSSRLEAVEAESRLQQDVEVNMAAGIISERSGTTIPEARHRMLLAAAEAGITQTQLAQAVISRNGLTERD
jgi:transcriptional regulator with GAF, ATPase, and Fis domain